MQHASKQARLCAGTIIAADIMVDMLSRRYIHFSKRKYTRNLVAYEETLSVILLCWEANQKTPIHDHGDFGMRTWVKVLQGNLSLDRSDYRMQ